MDPADQLPAVTPTADRLPALAPEIVEKARRFADASRARSTRDKYEAAWSMFSGWCMAQGHASLPAHPATVAAYIGTEADRGVGPSWIQLQLSAIGWIHRRAGYQPPHRVEHGAIIAEIMGGIRREHGAHGEPPSKKSAADADIVRDILRAIAGDSLRDVRDRALIAWGMASCMRRAELVALTFEDLVGGREGHRITIRRSKGDQEGKGVEIAVPEGRRLRPVALLEAWFERAAIAEGPLFRRISNDGRKVSPDAMSAQSVARVIKLRVGAAGLNPDDYAGHSLRAGFLTSAARSGASIFQMQAQSRHKSVDVLSGYVRSARLFEDHAGRDFL